MTIFSKQDCETWFRNKLINPITKRKIQEGKGVYKEIEQKCLSPSKNKKSKSPHILGKKNSLRKDICQSQPNKYKWIVVLYIFRE